MVTVVGHYIGSEIVTSSRDGKQETRTIVLIADGMDATKVYCDGALDMSEFALGDTIEVSVKPYSKSGVGYYHGSLLK